jgi:1,4-dihydroxy-2-naphthoate octaprenyltransferase
MWRKVSAWLALSRLPFHSVGVLPYVLGSTLVWRFEGLFRWDIFGLGTCGVILVMLATYLAGEYWDYAEDTISGEIGRSRFAGGSGVLQSGVVGRRTVLRASIACVALALADGLVLVLGFGVGEWALLLGVVGLVAGFFYSARPIRWVTTGWGELWIAFCYGWLPIAVGYYLQANSIASAVHWIAAPVGLTIFNVILLNEFPDYVADLATGKRNLTVRLGPQTASHLYAAISVASWGTALLAIERTRAPVLALWLYLPVLALSAGVTALVLMGRWRHRRMLDRLCSASILANLATTLAFTAAFALAR